MDINIIGLLVGLICGLPYIIITIKNKSTPNLIHFVEIILACIGVVVFTQFGIEVALAEDSYLGELVNQRLTIVIGAIALVWISVYGFVQVYLPLFIKDDKPDNKPRDNGDAKQDAAIS
ncbi:MAG: hypothetical protein JNK81_05625 [Anaerolineales bacterium]|nr:hypothetical protein [Anaerolineales bacterium]